MWALKLVLLDTIITFTLGKDMSGISSYFESIRSTYLHTASFNNIANYTIP